MNSLHNFLSFQTSSFSPFLTLHRSSSTTKPVSHLSFFPLHLLPPLHINVHHYYILVITVSDFLPPLPLCLSHPLFARLQCMTLTIHHFPTTTTTISVTASFVNTTITFPFSVIQHQHILVFMSRIGRCLVNMPRVLRSNTQILPLMCPVRRVAKCRSVLTRKRRMQGYIRERVVSVRLLYCSFSLLCGSCVPQLTCICVLTENVFRHLSFTYWHPSSSSLSRHISFSLHHPLCSSSLCSSFHSIVSSSTLQKSLLN